MDIILLKDIKGKGCIGDIIKVKLGYARHLIRNQLGISATPKNLKQFQESKKKELVLLKAQREKATSIADILKNKTLNISSKSQDNGNLFGSIGIQDIATALNQNGTSVIEKKQIILKEPIKSLGTYEVPISLGFNIMVNVKLNVKSETTTPQATEK